MIVPPGIALLRAGWFANQAKTAISSMRRMVELGDFGSAQSETKNAKQSFEDLQNALQGVGFWREMPYIGVQIRSVESAAGVSAQSLDGLHDILQVAVYLNDALSAGSRVSGTTLNVSPTDRLKDLTKEDRRRLLEALYRSLPDLRLAREKINIALTLWNSIPKDEIANPVKKALQPLANILPVMQRSLDQAIPLIEVLIPLAGYPNPQQYVIALQNADEIRPAGGFIGSVVQTSVDSANLDTFEFYDVYNIDNPASGVWNEKPPEPIVKHLGVKAWFMRDANWSPDFPTSAERVLDFYERETAIRIGQQTARQSGFVAFEPGVFKSLLHLTGPVMVDGQEFNENNFMDLLEYEVEMKPGITPENRKDLMGLVGDALVERIHSLPSSRWPDLLNLVARALQQKQIMVYSRNADLQAKLDAHNWSGRTLVTKGDFIWVIDANLAALKTDGVMRKTITYTVDATNPLKPIASVSLGYQNLAQEFSWRYTRYRSYSRVYVPEGSTLISSKGAMQNDLNQTGGKFIPGNVDVMKDLGKSVFGAFWSIEPRRSGTLSFTYNLPANVIQDLQNGKYHLDWPKQPGADNTEFNVKIILPRNIIKANPPEPDAKWGDNIYEVQTDSQEDRSFDVSF